MGSLVLSFTPPKNWQDFELLTKEVARKRFDTDFDLYGRSGQKQHGVDITGMDKDYRLIGIQCKHKKQDSPKSKRIHLPITQKIIEDEISKAGGFKPPLNRFIIATTSFRDTSVQAKLAKLNTDGIKKGLFPVEIWFWETFEEEINNHIELAYLYFEKTLKALGQYNKDQHILYLLKAALQRPAFTTPFHLENNSTDFLQAIIDTQRAFNTGKLYDRDKKILASSYSADKLSEDADRKVTDEIKKELQEIRNFTTDQMGKGNIRQLGNILEFPWNVKIKVPESLNEMRRKVLTEFNVILGRHGINKIDSPLI